MGAVQSPTHSGPQPSNVASATNTSLQPVLPFKNDNDSPVEIRISGSCKIHEWRNLRMTITARSLAIIRNDPRKQAITQALANGFQTLKDCTLSDSGNFTPVLRFKCGDTRFIANGVIHNNEVTQWAVCSAEEQPEDTDFTLLLRRGGEKRTAEGSPPRSPSTLQRMALLQRQKASGSPIASDSAERLVTPEPIDEEDYPRYFAEAMEGMSSPNPEPDGKSHSPAPQTPHGLPIEEQEDQILAVSEGYEPATPARDDSALLVEEGIVPEEQRAFEESVNLSRRPDAVPSNAAGESSSRTSARTMPTVTDAFSRYAEVKPLPQVQKIIEDEPAISLADLFKKIDPVRAKNNNYFNEAEYFHTHVMRQLKADNATGERKEVTTVLVSMATFLSTRKAYETLQSSQIAMWRTFLNAFEETIFGQRPLVKRVSEGLDDPSESNPFKNMTPPEKEKILFGARKFDAYLNERIRVQTSPVDSLEGFLEAKHAYYSNDKTDKQVINFLNYGRVRSFVC